MPLTTESGELNLLLTQRAQHLKHHAGQVSFPGGSLEAHDADVIAAALRETEEEVGIGPDVVAILGALAPRLTITGFRVTPVVGWLAEQPILALDPAEVMAAFKVPVSFLADAANQKFRTREFAGSAITMVEWEFDGYRIWGATAQMILEMLSLLDRPNSTNA